jgi:hypothetical protein
MRLRFLRLLLFKIPESDGAKTPNFVTSGLVGEWAGWGGRFGFRAAGKDQRPGPRSFYRRQRRAQRRGSHLLFSSAHGRWEGTQRVEPEEEVQWELLDQGEPHLAGPNAPAPTTKSNARK